MKWANIAIIGPAQHGKSTLTGYTLTVLDEVDSRVLEEAQEAAEERGDLSRKYAFILDRKPHERKIKTASQEKGKGQTLETSWWGFENEEKQIRYLLMDSPGHYKQMVEHVTAALSHADAVVLVVDVADYMKTLQQHGEAWRDADGRVIPTAVGQIQAYLASAHFYDVRQIIVAVHKMDLVNFSHDFYNTIKSSVLDTIEQLEWKPPFIRFVPTAVLSTENRGFNIDRDDNVSELNKWYHGPSFIETLFELTPRPAHIDGNFRMQVNYAYQGKHSGVIGYELVFTGKIITGRVQLRDELVIQPTGTQCRVRSIKSIDASSRVYRERRWDWEPRQQAEAGQHIGLGCTITKYGSYTRDIRSRSASSGDVVGQIDSPPKVSKRLRANILLLHMPPLDDLLDARFSGVFGMGYFKTGFKIVRYSLDGGKTYQETSLQSKDHSLLVQDLWTLKDGDSLPVEIMLERDAPLDPNLAGTELGRFVILDKALFVLAGGKITEVL